MLGDIYFNQLDAIQEHYKSGDLYTFTINENGLEKVPGNFLGRLVTWFLQKIGYRTNDKLIAEFAKRSFSNLEILLDLEDRKLNIGEIDADFIERVKEISQNILFKPFSLLVKADQIEDKRFQDCEDIEEFFDAEEHTEWQRSPPSPISSDLSPPGHSPIPSPRERILPEGKQFGDDARGWLIGLLHQALDNGEAGTAILSLLPKNLESLEYDEENKVITLTFEKANSGVIPQFEGADEWWMLRGRGFKISKTLQLKIDSSSIQVLKGELKGTYGFLSLQITAVQANESGFFVQTSPKPLSSTMCFENFRTVFGGIQFA